jgi:hypothetical protein
MSGNSSTLSVDEQQATIVTTKRKEDNAAATAQAVAAIAHREQEALIAIVAAARKTLDETRMCERVAALAWEQEKTNARHLEQQLVAAQGIVIPQDDDDRSIDIGSNPDATLTAHLHAQAADLHNI